METIFHVYIDRFLVTNSVSNKGFQYYHYLLFLVISTNYKLLYSLSLAATFFWVLLDNWWSECYILIMRNGHFLSPKNKMNISFIAILSSPFRPIHQPFFHDPSLLDSKLKISPNILPRQFLGKKFYLGTYLEKPKAGKLFIKQL